MFINRTYTRTEVQPCLGTNQEAVAIYDPATSMVLGWKIQYKNE